MRCAIYTRKSSEEGLEQEFNSLHAQREACEAFIKSQRHEGWTALKEKYDDGGVSGGTMKRPALQKLLADIHAGKVDIVVVYKVDRLTRALSDFARMVDLFDEHGVSFVSVTQQFNTTTSMGRLTLNVLLSFAQFEREVTGERIRDKIAASKKKGLWMGGNIPMGYDVRDRRLVIDESHAEVVRQLFRLYVERGSTRAVAEEAERRGYLTPRRMTKAGKNRGGNQLSRGHINQILTNRVYIGEIPHKDESYPGEHEAIIDRQTWEAAQAVRKRNGAARCAKTNVKAPSLLGGLLFDAHGEPLTPSHAVKGGKRYRYYVSKRLVTGEGTKSNSAMRVPAGEIERIVISALMRWLGNESAVLDAVGTETLSGSAFETPKQTAALATRFTNMSIGDQAAVLAQICTRIELGDTVVSIRLSAAGFAEALGVTLPERIKPEIIIDTRARLVRVGGETRMLRPEDESQTRGAPDPAIIRALARAYDWKEQLVSGRASSISKIADADRVSPRYVARLLPLAFLAPEIVERLLRGDHAATLSAEDLTRQFEFDASWQRQELSV